MELKYATTSRIEHKTDIRPARNAVDGGRAWIIEAFDFIHGERQVGELTVQFGVGGCVSDMKFRESVAIPQREIDFAPIP